MRLIDLHNNWLRQYAGETTLFDAAAAAEVAGRLRRLNGYLTDTSVVFLATTLTAAVLSGDSDRWHALGELLARYEAEFSGRLLIGPEDLARFRSEPADSLTWGVLAISGFDSLVRDHTDLERFNRCDHRGVRSFQLIASSDNLLGGSDEPGDDRGLSPLGFRCLEAIVHAAMNGSSQVRLLIDLARQNGRTMNDVLNWIGDEPARSDHLIPIHSHGSGQWLAESGREERGRDVLWRIMTYGGIVAIDPDENVFAAPEAFYEAIETLASLSGPDSKRFNAIAMSSSYLSLDRVPRGLDDVEHVIRSLSRAFDPEIAGNLMAGNADRLLDRMMRLSE